MFLVMTVSLSVGGIHLPGSCRDHAALQQVRIAAAQKYNERMTPYWGMK
jgi:hypothetical protein